MIWTINKKETECWPKIQKQNVAKLRDEPYKHLFGCRVKEICKCANGFNKYFADIGPSLSSKIPVGKGNIYDHMQTKMKDSIFLIRITEFEVLKTVKNCKKKKSNDPHGLSIEILKQVIPNIVKPLPYICNKSFLEGCFPDSMKISRIVPIFKAGEKVH